MKKIIFILVLTMVSFIGNAQYYLDADHDSYGNPNVMQTQPLNGFVTNSSDLNDNDSCITNVPAYIIRYYDNDGDGFGSGLVYCNTVTIGKVNNNLDCNDADATINPNTIWYRDADGDGFGVSAPTITGCLKPVGYANNASDYNDTTANITNIAPSTFYQDADGDTFGNPSVSVYYSIKPAGYVTNNTDCDDTNAQILSYVNWHPDADGDGYGNPLITSTSGCIAPVGYVSNGSDCNDANAAINPNTVWYRDADGDGFGTSTTTTRSCLQPAGYVANNLDCNDADATINPNTIWYRDADGDGFGVSAPTITGCLKPVGYANNASDYNDTTANITNIAPSTFYQDADGDTFGNPSVSVYYSIKPAGYVTNNTDCDDTNAQILSYVNWHPDADGDGYGNPLITSTSGCIAPVGYVSNGSDCNDANAAINPNTVWYRDADGDGFGTSTTTTRSCLQPAGYVANNLDCNDADAAINPNTIWYHDADGDGYGTQAQGVGSPPGSPQIYSCAQIAGYVLNNADCNDADPALNPNTKWYADTDLDGLGDPASFVAQCTQPVNYVSNNSDNCPLIKGSLPNCADIGKPSQDQNYILTKGYKIPTTTAFVNPSADKVKASITYFDGLGRPIQQIANQQSGSGKDITTNIEYDAFGRQDKDYLPYPSTTTDMIFDANAKTGALSYYNTPKYENTANPYSQKLFESSPLNRVLKQAAPGTDWTLGNGHEIKLDYQTNTASEVKLFAATATWSATTGLYDIALVNPTGTVFYDINQLYKTITYNENTTATPAETAGSTVEFKNKEGQVVLKRTYDASVIHDTYYVYDPYGNLTYVIPPKADVAITQTILDNLCYQYKYDYRNRLVEKKLPSKQWEFIVYDKLDRVVATGPAFSPFTTPVGNGWLATKYDAFNRPVLTAWTPATVTSATRKTLQDSQNAAITNNETKIATATNTTVNAVAFRYTNVAWPTTAYHVLTVNYYDDYNFPNAPTTLPALVETQTVFYNTTTKPKALPTGSWVRIPETSALIKNELSYTLYDNKARPIRSYTTNHLGGYTYTDSKLDLFSGQLQYSITRHKRLTTDVELMTKDAFTYSPQDRLLTHTHQINNGVTQTLVANTYDELGQLTSKNVGGTTAPLQKVDYTYNIRGWLTGINDINTLTGVGVADLFAFKLNYNTTENCTGYTGTPLYNGNIAETYWRTATDNVQRKYGYQYDQLNRLKNAIYQKPGATPALTSVTNMYNETLTYDKNGNIQTLLRNGDTDTQIGVMPIDNLTYTYGTNTNQLQKVADTANKASGFIDGTNTTNDYTYDLNGNLITDANKNITTITYNHLNLPTKITFGTTGNITYIYNATGQKLEKIVTQGAAVTSTNYLVGFQYSKPPSGVWGLQYFPTAEGYVNKTGTVYSYVYNYTDHLGNVRVSYGLNTTNVLTIFDENNYYPFGLKHKGYNAIAPAPSYKYKYNGKELQDELGLNVYDMDARNYMPDIGRWGVIDELAEDFYEWSPYNFSFNNPIIFSDPSGMGPEGVNYIASTFIDPKGKVVEHRDDGDDNVYLVGNDWKPGGSKNGLPVGGKEKSGVDYLPGVNYQFDENGELGYLNPKTYPPRPASGAITPMGGAFDIFGVWEVFWNSVFEASGADENEGTALAFALVSKGKAKPKTIIRALNGLQINGFVKHALNRSIGDFSRKGLKPKSILDALKNPLIIKDVVTDGLGRQSQRFIGRTGEVVVNPSLGKIISVNPASSSKVAKLLKQIKE